MLPNCQEQIPLSSQTRHDVMMTIKEALHNVIKHARATEVTVQVAFDGQWLELSITDNGCGFQSAAATPGNGLVNMRRRIRNIGGTCRVESQPGQGASVRLRLSNLSKGLNHARENRCIWEGRR